MSPATGESGALPWISGEDVLRRMSFAEAVDVLEATLRNGFDPENDGQRSRHPTPTGELLQMPSATRQWCGTKLVTLRPENDQAGLPVIQGVYVLFDGETLTPLALLDGAALTALRTPAVTALALRHLAAPNAARVTLFGTGVQARAHIQALQAVLPITHIDVVGRSPHKTAAVVASVEDAGLSATPAGAGAVAEADVVLCCTASPDPLFDAALVPDHAVIAAIGSHDPVSREVATALVQRAEVVVESVSSAKREAGDLIIPAEDGAFDWDEAIGLKHVVSGHHPVLLDRPRLFKGTGMPWQDLAVAAGIYQSMARSGQ